MFPTFLPFTERHPRYVALMGFALFVIGFVLYGFQQINLQNALVTQDADSNESKLVIPPEVEEKIRLQTMMSEIITSRDFTQCDKINDQGHKVDCINSIALALANETGDISYCDRLDNEKASKDDCRNEIPFQASLVHEDITICNQLPNIERKELCTESFYEVLARYKDDITICDQYSHEMVNQCRDRFLVMKALSHPSESISCAQITDEALRADCELLIKPRSTFSDMTTSTCPPFKSDFLKQGCLNQTASSASNTIGKYPQ